MDLGQPIETWDTSCRATKVVVGLSERRPSRRSVSKTLFILFSKEVVGSFAMSWYIGVSVS